MELKTFSSEAEFIQKSLEFITDCCDDNCNIALSGGNTPKTIYEALSETETADSAFFLVDERYVPSKHSDSNTRMIRETLKPDHFHHFDTSTIIDESLEKYENALPKQFDLCILGIGADGHIASLFPHSKALNSKNSVAHSTTTEFPIKDRLTLTFKPIMNSKKLLLLVKGESKKQILDELQNSDKSIDDLPAKKLLEHSDFTIHFCNC